MSVPGILDEIDSNEKELRELAVLEPNLKLRWSDIGFGTGSAVFGLLGMLFTVHLSGSGLILGFGGLACFGAEVAQKVGNLKGPVQISRRIDYLTMRQALLKNTLARRHPSIKPPP